MKRTRRPLRQQLSFGLINIFLGLGAFITDGQAPRWIGGLLVILGSIFVAKYIDQTISWLEKLSASLAAAAHDPALPVKPQDRVHA